MSKFEYKEKVVCECSLYSLPNKEFGIWHHGIKNEQS